MKTVLTRLKIKIKIESKIKKKYVIRLKKGVGIMYSTTVVSELIFHMKNIIINVKKLKRHFSVVVDSFLLYLPNIILNPTPTNPVGSFT